jgi:hypothetical protein
MEMIKLLPKTRATVPVFWEAVKDHEIQELFPFERETLEDAISNLKYIPRTNQQDTENLFG